MDTGEVSKIMSSPKLSHNRMRFLAFLYLVLVYLFGTLKFGAWSDDFWSLEDPHAHFLHAVKDGRPIYGWAIEFLFSMFTSVESLKYIRLLGLVGLLLFSDAAIRYLLDKKLTYQVVIASLVAFTLPSFQLSVHWAIAFCMGWTGFLALQGLTLWERSGLRPRILGVVLFSVSLLIYPLLSFFIFAIMFVDLYLSSLSLSAIYQRVKTVFPLLILGGLLSATVSRLVLLILDLEYNPRVEIISLSQLPEKLSWFLTRPLLLSYRPFLIDSPSTVIIGMQFVIFSLALVLLIFLRLKELRKAFFFLVFLNLNLAMGLFPFLISTQNQIEVRFLSSNTWLVTFLFVNLIFSAISSVCNLRKRLERQVIVMVSTALLAFGGYSVNDRYVNFIKPIQKVSRDFILGEIQKCTATGLELGVEVVQRVSPWPSRNLLGMYSQVTDLASEWVPIGAVKMILTEKSPLLNRVGPIDWGQGSSIKCVVDLNLFHN